MRPEQVAELTCSTKLQGLHQPKVARAVSLSRCEAASWNLTQQGG